MPGGLHAEYSHSLQIRPVVAARRDAPLPEMLLQIGRGEGEARRENGATLEVVRGDIGQPFLEIGCVERGESPRGSGPDSLGWCNGEKGSHGQAQQAGSAWIHATSMG